jgi:hypothetical protein
MQNGIATLKNNLVTPQKVNMELSYDPAISLLDMQLREMKTYAHTKLMNTNSTLFIISPKWKQSKCPSIDD